MRVVEEIDQFAFDLSMPWMNGTELGRRLRQRFPPAPLRLIALSGYAVRTSATRASPKVSMPI